MVVVAIPFVMKSCHEHIPVILNYAISGTLDLTLFRVLSCVTRFGIFSILDSRHINLVMVIVSEFHIK